MQKWHVSHLASQNFAVRRGFANVLQAGMPTRQSLLESLDDSDDDFDGTSPILRVPAQQPLPQQAAVSDIDCLLPQLPAVPPDGEGPDFRVAMATQLAGDAASWQLAYSIQHGDPGQSSQPAAELEASVAGCSIASALIGASPVESTPTGDIPAPKPLPDTEAALQNMLLTACSQGASNGGSGPGRQFAAAAAVKAAA